MNETNESQISEGNFRPDRKTFSCSYVEPLTKGNGINVKTANLTWVTSSMIATTLSTAGLEDANVVVASLFPVSGTGGLTGVMKAFEDATGEKLEEEKKEIASEELIITGDLAEDIGQDKATGVINDIKNEIIKNDTKDTTQIADTIINITNNYNVNLSTEQQKQIEELMLKIAKQDYDYNKIKDTLQNVSSIVEKNLEELGEKIKDPSFIEGVKGWFTSAGEWFSNLFAGSNSEDLGILGSTNDSVLGDDVTVDATDDKAIKLPDKEEVQGFFDRVWNWFTGLFNKPVEDSNDNSNQDKTENTSNSESENNDSIISPDAEENTHFNTNDKNSTEQNPSEENNSQDTPAQDDSSSQNPGDSTQEVTN